ncbi:uncharacterized protein DMAD_07796 [Drosophila madeirensis]|uniref:Uncharacterized protein n=1 Tax=Drosophila madeirensis TaxID=30013 RepID=A0AAU9EPL3_DROMD
MGFNMLPLTATMGSQATSSADGGASRSGTPPNSNKPGIPAITVTDSPAPAPASMALPSKLLSLKSPRSFGTMQPKQEYEQSSKSTNNIEGGLQICASGRSQCF